jgi:hypothetical protein
MGVKVSDTETIPLCTWCHTELHSSTKRGSYLKAQQEQMLRETKQMLEVLK